MWNVHLPGILRNIKVFRCFRKDWLLERTRMREEGTTAKSMNEAKKSNKASGHETMARHEQRMEAHCEGRGFLNGRAYKHHQQL